MTCMRPDSRLVSSPRPTLKIGTVIREFTDARWTANLARSTATVRAVTGCRVVSYLAADLPARDLRELAAGHYRENQ